MEWITKAIGWVSANFDIVVQSLIAFLSGIMAVTLLFPAAKKVSDFLKSAISWLGNLVKKKE